MVQQDGVAATATGAGPPGSDEMPQLRRFIDSLPAMVGYWDHERRNVIANAAYLEYFGLTPGQIRGLHIREVLGEAVYALNLPYIDGVMDGREQLFQRTLVDRHGMTRHTQASYVPDIVDGEVRGFVVQVTDVTARVEAERARDEAVRLFEISMAHAPIGKVVVDTAGIVLQANPAVCRLLRCTEQDLVGGDFRRFVHPDNLESGETEFTALLNGTASHLSSERKYLRGDGTAVWLQRDFVLVPAARNGQDLAVAQFQDVTARRAAENELARLAVTDQLTGLPNRRALVERLERHHAECPEEPIGVLFIDLDGFKHVNDVHGHAVGDAVLSAAAQRLAGLVGPPNTAYRLGGDEFVVLIPVPPDSTGSPALVRRVALDLSAPYPTATTPVRLAASVGYAQAVTDDVESLLRAADAEMYRHKSSRRRRVTRGR